MSEAKVSAAKAAPSAQPEQAPCTHGRLAGRGGEVASKSRPGMRPIPVSRDAQRVATAILEVLAGVRTPTEAAAALSLSVPRYYLWEQRALEGLVRACEPRPVGKVASERHQLAVLEKEVVRLRQDCVRQQALVRASQRTVGLAGPPPAAGKPAAKSGGKAAATTADAAGKAKRKRRPVARALKAAAALQVSPAADHDHEYTVPETPTDSSSAIAAGVVQQSVLDNLLQATAAAGPVPAVPEA